MQYKKAQIPAKVYKDYNYEKMNYTGIAGFLFKINHWLLELGVDQQYNEHILEIGGGAKPHLDFLKFKNFKSYTIVDNKKIFYKSFQIIKKKNKNLKVIYLDYKKDKIKKNFYTRLISSHTFEHFSNFEDSFLKILPSMRKDSLLSVALPCDPGTFWRILQYFSYFKQKNIYGWKNFLQKDLDDSRDHITPVQNIIKILNYYFNKRSFIYFPLFFPLISLNIFIIIQIKLGDFRNKI
jgi:hypothetical protein